MNFYTIGTIDNINCTISLSEPVSVTEEQVWQELLRVPDWVITCKYAECKGYNEQERSWQFFSLVSSFFLKMFSYQFYKDV